MAQPVDPFIPVSPRPTYLKKRPLPRPITRTRQDRVGNDILPLSAPQPRRATTNAVPRPTAHLTHQTASRVRTPTFGTRDARQPRKQSRWLYYAKLTLACIVMLAVGSLAQVAVAGEILIGIYAIWAFVTKIPSRTTFSLALGTFGAVLLLLIIKPDQILMKNFATYAFLFLLAGAISLAREARG